MDRKNCFVLAALVVCLVGAPRLAAGDDTGAGEGQVRQLLNAQEKAWNHGDLEGFMAGYWKSPDLTFFSDANVTSGWQPTLDRYRKRYQSEGREMGKLTFSDLRIAIAGNDAAWVRGRWKVVTSKQTLDGLFTLIVKKMPEGWRIVHDHTSAGTTERPGDQKKN